MGKTKVLLPLAALLLAACNILPGLQPQFPKRYEVRWYPDGSRAVAAWDLEALKIWYKRVLRG